MSHWRGQRVVVTGGAGFLGSHVVDRLRAAGCASVVVPRRRDVDLTERAAVRRLLDSVRPSTVLHLAAVVGGIGANRAHPARFFYENAVMGVELLEAARIAGVGKVVVVGTACEYPRETAVPFREDDLWNGYPEETNAPYAIAKRALLAGGQAYRREYGLPVIHVLPANLYGPRDSFDLEHGHVIPALVRKCVEARRRGERTVSCWGSGTASREFLYVDDAARGLLLAAEHYDDEAPVNLATGEEITIRALAATIARIAGYDGEFTWDATRPDGQPRRRLDTSRAERAFGFRATIPLEDGLARTLRWFEETVPGTGAAA
ncbi:MAG: GDP-L-fucose synthase [Burkholderiales bacterium]|nr:GDP-L-fucose synthase [Burkholderiales bacterium]